MVRVFFPKAPSAARHFHLEPLPCKQLRSNSSSEEEEEEEEDCRCSPLKDEKWVEYDGGMVQDCHRSARWIRMAPDVAVIPEEAFMDCDHLIAVDLSNVTAISESSFHNCKRLKRVISSTASAVKIGESAFCGCGRLAEIEFSNVTEVGNGAFCYCEALTHVTIPSSAVIEGDAFHLCDKMTEVNLGNGVQCIEDGTFRHCDALVKVVIPPSVTTIGSEAFLGCSSLREVELNVGLQRIGEGAFKHCTSLQGISVPSTTVEVGSRIFAACNSLERITISSSSSITVIGAHAFEDCHNLDEVTLHEGLHCIEDGAFSNCDTLEHINIPPIAFAIDIERSSCQLMRTSMPKPQGRTLVASKWMQYRSPSQLEHAQTKVNEILGRRPHTEGQRIRLIRELFAYFDLSDISTMLELAIWKANMNGIEQDAAARQAIRRRCGNDINVIIPCVMLYLK